MSGVSELQLHRGRDLHPEHSKTGTTGVFNLFVIFFNVTNWFRECC